MSVTNVFFQTTRKLFKSTASISDDQIRQTEGSSCQKHKEVWR